MNYQGLAIFFWVGVISHIIARRKAVDGMQPYGLSRVWKFCYWIVGIGFLYEAMVLQSGPLVYIKWSYLVLMACLSAWLRIPGQADRCSGGMPTGVPF